KNLRISANNDPREVEGFAGRRLKPHGIVGIMVRASGRPARFCQCPQKRLCVRREGRLASRVKRLALQLRNSASGSIGLIWTQKILKAARIGTARITPAIPHIQPQKMSERRIITGFKLRERPITQGVTKLPSRMPNKR